MSKKQKRQVSTSAPQRETIERPVVTTPSRSRANATEFNPDYSYVISDLKRIGTLAGTFFVVLVALSFFLR